ncbi:MAG: hypothetical protein M1825_001365 [Sarcosagium campestre]|nr:MAG: hypothetical protein M1825_001365 [Sarcosagium campestre]
MDVDDGSTVTDFLPAERARGITIQSAAITFHWPPRVLDGGGVIENNRSRTSISHTINLIDTPGHADFTFEVLRSLRVLDGAVCILDGVAGVEAQTEKVWSQANSYRIPRLIYINKLDRDGAAFGSTVKEIATRLKTWPAVCHVPWWEGADRRFVGVGDAVELRGMKWAEGGDGKDVQAVDLESLKQKDRQFAEEIARARVALVELLSEHDDEMVNKFLEHNEDHLAIPAVDIIESLRRCVLSGEMAIVPVFAGASFKNMGVQPLLDAIVNLLPEHTEASDPEIRVDATQSHLSKLINGIEFPQGAADTNKQVSQASSKPKHVKPKGSLEGCALAFKVVNDPRRGVLVYVRVYSGVINRNAALFNTALQVTERAPRLLTMYASDASETSSIPAGQIGVIVGLKHARTGDTLVSYNGINPVHGPPHPYSALHLRPIDIPPPVFFTSLEPESLSAEKHLHESLTLLLREDPSLHVSIDPDSGQTLLSGMGELHLEIARERLVKDFKARAEMGPIEISYRECVINPAGPVHVIFDKDIAGKRVKAGCEASVSPYDALAISGDLINSSSPAESSSAATPNSNLIRIQQSLSSSSSSSSSRDGSSSSNKTHTEQSSFLTPSQIAALHSGAQAALSRSPNHAYPVHSTRVDLTVDPARDIFGNDTTPAALSSAARLATQSALKLPATTQHIHQSGGGGGGGGDNTALMEPVMRVAISVDEASLGAVVHDLSSARAGQVISLDGEDDDPSTPLTLPSSTTSSLRSNTTNDTRQIDVSKVYAPPDPFGDSMIPSHPGNPNGRGSGNGISVTGSLQSRTILARVPLKEMVGYLSKLRSLTAGRGSFVMSVDRFERMDAQRERGVLGGGGGGGGGGHRGRGGGGGGGG